MPMRPGVKPNSRRSPTHAAARSSAAASSRNTLQLILAWLKWAESEQRRRQQQEDFRRSQEEAARRSAEWDSQRTTNEDGFYRLHRYGPGVDASFTRSGSGSEGKLFSYLSYISFLCFLPSILGVNDPFTRFHAKQGRKLFFTSLILSWIPGLNAIAWLAQVVLAVTGMRNVTNGEMRELPIVGRLGEPQQGQR